MAAALMTTVNNPRPISMLWTVTPWNWSSRTRSLRKDGKIFIMGYSYYTGEEYEQECDVESGMDILNFILSQKSFECHE
ncbi:hypothetical protein [Parabacteroides distasonis]|uniref:hypothetical protein n=1 Tax=Parabacteroides distasonis TaxID=823 RepID=UPI002164EF9B|nr:hypothetical protein [Parabacteroides distasonis]UVR12135.1 hypothetical protein NXW68_13285 [Parabacteroides distasonis]